ncbi:serine-rich adhesin for platelets [Eurosta solidaginis]|uniref:serine-rich adhesin for platelets n=1 Tax=Eurosta solidaginis TaxID=178769 RepID=UPI00353167E2
MDINAATAHSPTTAAALMAATQCPNVTANGLAESALPPVASARHARPQPPQRGGGGGGVVSDGNGSSNSSTTTSSPPQYSEDIRCAGTNIPTTLDLLTRQSSISSTKTCEVDLGDEERDTFSPVSTGTSSSSSGVNNGCSNQSSPSDAAHVANAEVAATSAATAYDNKVYDGAHLPAAAPKPAARQKRSNGAGSTGVGSGGVSASASAGLLHSTSKEEKQRQNEEIVIMETSSISSETGSWESVFPHGSGMASGSVLNTTALIRTTTSNPSEMHFNVDYVQTEGKLPQTPFEQPKERDKNGAAELQMHLLKEPDIAPYLRERTYSTGATATADTSSLFTGISTHSLLRDLERRENAMNSSGHSACFIDASSLRDEDEVLSYPSLDGQQSNEDVGKDEEEQPEDCTEDRVHGASEADEESPTKKLEAFHKAFAKCKVKSKDMPETVEMFNLSKSSSSSNSEAASATSTNNLSDEEKLWKREHENQKAPLNNTTKEPVGKSSPQLVPQQQQPSTNTHENVNEASSVSLATADADSSDSSEIVKLRREQEHKPRAPYIFQHNMQQFSIHPLAVSPKFPMHNSAGASVTHPTAVHAAHSDLSYTTDYSSSSPAPSLVWSEHEHRPCLNAGNRAHTADDYDSHLHTTFVQPDTPHNSIVHIENASSNNSSIHRDYTMSSSLSHQRDSGAYCSDATDSPIPMPRTPKRSKFDEANPIISGGASIKDFAPKQCESPPVQRRLESCPIVSGGFASLDFEPTRPLADDDEDEQVEMRSRSKTRKPIPGIASWVVDMSDCRLERRKSTSSTSSMETSAGKFRERSDSTSSHKSGCGFYVSLNDMDKNPSTDDLTKKPIKPQMSKSYTAPKPTGFFINLSKSEYADGDAEKAAEVKKEDATADKKNIFSMFIDIGGESKKPGGLQRKEPFSLAQRLSSSYGTQAAQRRADDVMRSSASSTETLMAKSSNLKISTENDTYSGESKSLDYRCNLEPPYTVAAIRRISQQQRTQNEASKRHSWGNNPAAKECVTGDYKRSISLTANGDCKENGGNGLMSIIDKIPIISKASSLSVDSSFSPFDELTGSKSELSTCSNNSARNSVSGGERNEEVLHAGSGGGANTNSGRVKRRRRDVQINETFDKSSLASITDGMLSKDISPVSTNTDTEDLTFQQDEELAMREAALQQEQQQQQQLQQIPSNRSSAIIMETIIETKETSSPKKSASSHTMESLHATIEKQKMLLETVNEHGEVEKAPYVKLSDMDKPTKFELHSPESMSKSVGNNHRQINRLFRDDSKARPHSWTMSRSQGNSFLSITNSVESLRSLSRLFPNFSKEFSNSLPNNIICDQMDYIQTDISGDSSLASSISRSGMDESSISCRQPRRLGEDLLKMFLQEIATDMIVEVHGRRIKAHKCILRSRCQYFAAMLAGSGATSVVSLQGYSYSAVHFALCHIYSGASHPPDGISLMELAALADLLGLEGLKEVTAHALKTNYCHNFHKPCSGCIDGILQVLPVALTHSLDDLYRKCLRWTCRHYMKVWPTRQFAQLPSDILGRCRQQIVAYMTSESVLDTVLDCDNLLIQLATYRWGGICESLVRGILDAAYTYIADHFASLIASDSFLSLGHDRSCHIPRLESVLLRTASSLTPDQACRSYQRVTRLNAVLQAKVIQMPANLGELAKELQGLQEEDLEWDTEYIRLVSAILSAVEQCLIRQCSRAMRITAWQRMDLDLRKKIQTLARLTEPMDLKRSSKPVSKAFTFSGSTRNQDLYQVKLAIQAHSKRAMAQDTQLYKATQTQEAGDVQTTERGVQANNDLREGTSKILKSNTRVHVPNTVRASSQSATTSERNSSNTHRRTQSEAPMHTTKAPTISASVPLPTVQSVSVEPKSDATKKPAVIRLSEVRPRYLEPRKVHTPAVFGNGPVRSATSSSIPTTSKAKGRQISSSDSSRTSSPATRRNANQIGHKSINMSLDSLASPSRRGRTSTRLKTNTDSADRFTDRGGNDSLAESMKNSVITNKAISQESLSNGAQKLSRSNPLIAAKSGKQLTTVSGSSGSKLQVGKTANGVTKTHRGTSIGTKPPKHLQQQNIKSTGSSPSSVTTTKSATSRLSSVSSTHSSRNMFKNRSISMPGQPSSATAENNTGGGQRHSFLSAKSREILARRAEKNKLQQEQQQQIQQQQTTNSSGDERSSKTNSVPAPTNKQHQKNQLHHSGPIRSASHTAVTATSTTNANYMRNSLPSNIPTRRPNSLQLRKSTQQLNNKNNNQMTNLNNKNKIINATNGVLKAAHAVKQKIELFIDTSTSATVKQQQDIGQEPRVETKLERSSTFCKERSDMDLNELQIIE